MVASYSLYDYCKLNKLDVFFFNDIVNCTESLANRFNIGNTHYYIANRKYDGEYYDVAKNKQGLFFKHRVQYNH